MIVQCWSARRCPSRCPPAPHSNGACSELESGTWVVVGCNTRPVGFFSELQPPEDSDREPEPHRMKWRGDADDTVGVGLAFNAVLVQTDQVAVTATGFFAYPTGFAFSLVTISRLSPSPVPLGMHPHPGAIRRGGVPGGEFRFGIGFSDATTAFAFSMHHRRGPDGELAPRILHTRGGGGGGRTYRQSFWCEPLPSPGSMKFVCEWPDLEIPETSVDIDASAIIEAASRSVPLWPEDVDLPDESGNENHRRGSGGWSSSTYGRMKSDGRP